MRVSWCLSLLLATARGWSAGVTETVDVLDPEALLARWSSGTNTSYTSGLKGGIAWALDPDFCERMLTRFPEETLWRGGQSYFFGDAWATLMPSLLRCEHLKQSIRTAMRAWEAANSNVRFFEVTSLCNDAWTTPVPPLPPAMPPMAPPTLPPNPSPDSPPGFPPRPPPSAPYVATPPLPPFLPGMAPTAPPMSNTSNITNATIEELFIAPELVDAPIGFGAQTFCDNASISCLHCPYAELIISAFDYGSLEIKKPSDRLGHDNAARTPLVLATREDETPLTAGADYEPGQWLRGDYRTNEWLGGRAPDVEASGQAIRSALIELDVGEERCWWYESDVCNMLFEIQAGNEADIHALFVSLFRIMYIGSLIGASYIVLTRLYVIFQLTALAWDTDGDGVVEFHEVAAALRLISTGWLVAIVNLFRKKKEKDPDAPEPKSIEWKGVLYGVFFSISRIDWMQFTLVTVTLFWPPHVIDMLINPCYECNDFYLTMLTQLGLVLGLKNYTRPDAPAPNPNATMPPSPPDAPDAPPAPPSPPTPFPPPSPGAPGLLPPTPPVNPPAWNLTLPPSPPYIFASDRTVGYNCSHPTQGVAPVDLSLGAPQPALSVMNQPRPGRFSIHNGFPRVTCPTADDADGLRYLYPECEELLPCEFAGGAERPPGENDTTIGCNRFMPADGEYSITLYYYPLQSKNWSDPNNTWSAHPSGRALANHTCLTDNAYKADMGRAGMYRVLLTFYHAMLPPFCAIIVLKVIGRICLQMPWMARTRKRNLKLQRMAAKRKAEVRRMNEAGQEFAVKRAARNTGKQEVANNILENFKKAAEAQGPAAAGGGKKPAGGDFLAKMKKTSMIKIAPDVDAAAAPQPAMLALTQAPAQQDSQPSFAEQMKALSAEAAAAAPAGDDS